MSNRERAPNRRGALRAPRKNVSIPPAKPAYSERVAIFRTRSECVEAGLQTRLRRTHPGLRHRAAANNAH